jgi:hypothetical protein
MSTMRSRRWKQVPILPILVIAYSVVWLVLAHWHRNVSGVPEAIHHHLEDFHVGAPRTATVTRQTTETARCALCFFGLPRSYQTMVLPSIQKNVLIPNAQHNCDVFVHYFYQQEEAVGRYNDGGQIDPTEIKLLEIAVNSVWRSSTHTSNSPSSPVTKFINDTNQEFLKTRNHELWRYHNVYDKEGDLLYFPWKKKSWDLSSLDNLVRQWHSIDAAFRLMEQHAQQNNINYTRVAMLRNDVMYLTPIDIMKMDNVTLDTENRHFIIPPFANYPVNDRMIYGPYEAVKVWSTKRFELIEERVQDPEAAGTVMHSELFMNESIFSSIEKLGFSRRLNPDICFVRTRANSVALVDDCLAKGETRGFRDVNRHDLVEQIIGRKCHDSESDSTESTESDIVYLTC